MINDISLFIERFGTRFENKTNTEVYEVYLKFCKNHGFEPYSKIGFGQQIVKFSDYKIINKTFKGSKYRIFVRKK